MRAVRGERGTRVEAHIVVPEFWTVEEAHDFSSALKHRVASSLGSGTEVEWNIVPCRRQHCASCEVDPCPIRVQPFAGRGWITLDDALEPGPVGQ
jgi:hypothetical protein